MCVCLCACLCERERYEKEREREEEDWEMRKGNLDRGSKREGKKRSNWCLFGP